MSPQSPSGAEVVPVTQVNWEAAAALRFQTRQHTADAMAADRMAQGEADESWFVQTFARHRLAEQERVLAEVRQCKG